MNIIDAIKSLKAFRRPGMKLIPAISEFDYGKYNLQIKIDHLLADDWETCDEETKAEEINTQEAIQQESKASESTEEQAVDQTAQPNQENAQGQQTNESIST